MNRYIKKETTVSTLNERTEEWLRGYRKAKRLFYFNEDLGKFSDMSEEEKAGYEYAFREEQDRKEIIKKANESLEPCPFCGVVPKIEWVPREGVKSGGVYYLEAYHKRDCFFSNIRGDNDSGLCGSIDIGWLVRTWNRRSSEMENYIAFGELVRCKDCKYSIEVKESGSIICKHPSQRVTYERTGDDYCSYGKRKQEE